MSALNNTVLNSTEQTPVRVKKPTLSAKYFKLMEFGYGLVRSLESNGILSADGVESAFSELKLMSSVDEQTVFYENCIAQSSNTGKLMKKFIALRNKPPSKPRTKKSARVENDSENDLVNQLVSAANAVENIPITDNISAEISTTSNEPKVTESKTLSTKEAKALAAKEAKEAKALAAKEAKDAKSLAAKESKSTSKKVKKTKVEEEVVVKEVVVVEEVKDEEYEDEDEEEEEIHTREFSLNGKDYLIDEQDIIYSIETHESIGLYDPKTNIITSTLE